ncbi:MAG: hypothetical protein M1823_005680 [Watsoniomyces obsoletus]|nr:MAG: hypothetical protein M1823_005680 [Watsoniomyces obsoletus]
MEPANDNILSKPLPKPVRDWIRRHAKGVHPAFGSDSSYESQRASGDRLRRQSQADRDTEDFCLAMQLFDEQLKPKGAPSDFDIHGQHTWEEVLQAAAQAEEKYDAEGKGKKGAVRKFFRKTGDCEPAMKPWLGLLPTDKYFSILCGGLKLVLQAVARRSSQRQHVLEALGEVQEIILSTQRCVRLFEKDAQLRERALALYLALLEMIQGFVFELEKSIAAKLKDALRGELSNLPIEERRKCCQGRMKALEDHVEYLMKVTHLTTHEAVTEVARVTRRTEAGMNYVRSSAVTTDITMKKLSNDMSGLNINVATYHEDVKEMLIQSQVRSEPQAEALINLAMVLTDLLKQAEWHTILRDLYASSSTGRSDMRLAHRDRLLGCLDIDLALAHHELDRAFRQSQTLDPHLHSQASWLLGSVMFQSWLTANTAGILLVEGNFDGYGMGRISPMTLLCCLFIKTLMSVETARVLYFFCGLHNSPTDPMMGPRGLLRSLVAQLLMTTDPDLRFINSRHWWEQLQRHDIHHLCHLLWELMRQLPERVLFCVIDGASLFELQGWSDEMQQVVRLLHDMSIDTSLDVMVKVLLTSPGRCRSIKQVVPPEHHVMIPKHAGHGDGRSLNWRSLEYETFHRRSSRAEMDPEKNDNIFDHGCE